ncbi:MAG: hypothetical protein FGF50_06575, partial [Candidatus Brockarchaeota archaeon]|nr:hypothetical protein [Candidatus Brockarchaeota archaeon]
VEERAEELSEELVKEVIEEKVEEPIEEAVEERVEELVEEVEEAAEKEVKEERVLEEKEVDEVIKEAEREEVEEVREEEVEELAEERTEESAEELEAEVSKEATEGVEEEKEETVELVEEGEGPPEGPPEVVAAGGEEGEEPAREEPSELVNYPEGLKVKCVLRRHKDNLRIRIPSEQLKQYLGKKSCWVKIEVKGGTFYKKYGPTFEFDLPSNIGQGGEEVEIKIVKITTYEFVKTAFKEANVPFDIAFSSGEYRLIVDGKEFSKLTLERDLHYDRSEHGPAVTFAIKNYKGKEHLIKLVYRESKEYIPRIMISEYRRIKIAKYEADRKKLVIEYYTGVGEATSRHEAFLEDPEKVLVGRVEEVGDLINKGFSIDDPRVKGPVGEIGWDYARFYREKDVKEVVSRKTGIPKEKLEVVQGYETEGPDFYVYHKGKLVAIVEVKTTIVSDYYQRSLSRAKKDLNNYFTEEKWKHLWEAAFGIPVAICLENLNKIIETEFKEGVKCTLDDIEETVENIVEKPKHES